MPESQEDLISIQEEALAFCQTFKTVILSTTDHHDMPNASYAPYYRDTEGHFYIFISQLAQHTQNLISAPHASLLFIADEKDTQNLFARQRLTLQCSATILPPTQPSYEGILDELESRHGNMVTMLRSLPDFRLFQLTPEQGRYVRGFANAWDLAGPQLVALGLRNGR
ncbi:MAG: HugZ family pyridoxamine 5'-phosphate oxidase [bacterium]